MHGYINVSYIPYRFLQIAHCYRLIKRASAVKHISAEFPIKHTTLMLPVAYKRFYKRCYWYIEVMTVLHGYTRHSDDFVFKIRSAIRDAYQRRDELNRIISKLDFGKDKYQFVITKNKGADGKYYKMFMDDSLQIRPSDSP